MPIQENVDWSITSGFRTIYVNPIMYSVYEIEAASRFFHFNSVVLSSE